MITNQIILTFCGLLVFALGIWFGVWQVGKIEKEYQKEIKILRGGEHGKN